MKRAAVCVLAFAVSMFTVPFAVAQGMGAMDMKGMEMKKDSKPDKKTKSQTHKASGTVTKVDAERSQVTIAHGPVQSMKWRAMTMSFEVEDKAMLDKVKPGQNVEFSFVQSGKDYTITALK